MLSKFFVVRSLLNDSSAVLPQSIDARCSFSFPIRAGAFLFPVVAIRLFGETFDPLQEYRYSFLNSDSQIYPEDITETKTFIANARLAIAEGRAVFYDSWW